MARKPRRAKMARNNIRFARVPTGNETCGWCFMLSSRGLVYSSESSAMASSHKGCDCVIVPGVEYDTIDGYDPKGMAERWRDCVDTVSNASLERRARAEWDAMSDAEKRRYYIRASKETTEFLKTLQKTDRKRLEKLGIGESQLENSAFRRFYQERLRIEACNEVETRGSDWLHHDIPGHVTKERGAKPLPKERDLAELLSNNGFDVMFLKEINTSGVKTADAEIMGEIWEFKIPESWTEDKGVHTVRKQFYKALGKGTDKIVISNGCNNASFFEMANAVQATLETGDYAITEAIVADVKSGKILRLKK